MIAQLLPDGKVANHASTCTLPQVRRNLEIVLSDVRTVFTQVEPQGFYLDHRTSALEAALIDRILRYVLTNPSSCERRSKIAIQPKVS